MGGHFNFCGDINGSISYCPHFYQIKVRWYYPKKRLLAMAKRKYWIRGVMVLTTLLILWVAYVSSQQIERNRRIGSEVDLLQNEAEKIRHENQTLSDKISYFSSNDFREQEAKEKLGMKKDGEEVVIIKSQPRAGGNNVAQNGTLATVSPGGQDRTPNYQKWWRFFFQTNE